MSNGGGTGAAPRPSPIALAVLCAAQFMVVLDVAIVNVALASIQKELGFSTQDLQWVVNAYALAFGGFLLLGGRMADLLGRRRVFVAGLLLFSTASLLGGLAQSPGLLIAARGLQGLGGALVSPSALSLLTTLFKEGPERNRAMGVWGATAASGAASGVLLGGLLTAALGWEWVLFVNVPIGLATAFFSLRFVPDTRGGEAGEKRTFDAAGAITITAGLVLLVYAVIGTEQAGWASPRTLSLVSLAFALIGLFVLIERRTARPLVSFAIFRQRSLLGANLVALVHGTGPLSTLFFGSLFLQQVKGFDARQTGLAFLPFALMAALSSTFAARLVKRFGVGPLTVAGLLLMAAGLAWFSRLGPASSYLLGVLPGALLVGTGVTTAGVPIFIAANSGVKKEDSGLAAGLINTSQQIGAALVLALLVTLASGRTAAAGDGDKAALSAGFHLAFLVGACLLALGAVAALWLIRSQPAAAENPDVVAVTA